MCTKQNCKMNLKMYLRLILDLHCVIKDDALVHFGFENCFAICICYSSSLLREHRVKANTDSSQSFYHIYIFCWAFGRSVRK